MTPPPRPPRRAGLRAGLPAAPPCCPPRLTPNRKPQLTDAATFPTSTSARTTHGGPSGQLSPGRGGHGACGQTNSGDGQVRLGQGGTSGHGPGGGQASPPPPAT
eukprot:7129347-Pyramimonas_sp.AAC.1